MKRLDRILVVIDPTAQTQPAASKAARLARSSGAVLELFACDFDPALADRVFTHAARLSDLRAEFVARLGRLLEQLAADFRAEGLCVETRACWDNPLHRGIVRHVRETSPDLVVKDTHFHSALRRTLVTNTDWSLIRSCPAPLLLVKATPWPASPRVMAALDPGHLADKPAVLDHDILDGAALLARCLGGELHAVHAFFPDALVAVTTGMAAMPLAASATATEIVDTERHRAEAGLAAVLASYQLPPQRVHVLQGSASEVLPQAAHSQQADIVVMGAVSRSRLEEIFIGSTAERVLDRIACDTLVVKPVRFDQDLPF
jgi:universal stress protein E